MTTVDPADLRNVIRDALDLETVELRSNQHIGGRLVWQTRKHPDAVADAILAALTAAGWPNTYQPDPHVTAAREARAEAERDEAQRALAGAKEQLGETLAWDAKADFARVREELRQAELGWANTRRLLDKACRDRDAALSASPFRSTGTAMAEIERLRAELAEARTRETKAVEDATRLRAGITEVTDTADEEIADWRRADVRAEATPSDILDGYQTAVDRLRALAADGPTTAPNAPNAPNAQQAPEVDQDSTEAQEPARQPRWWNAAWPDGHRYHAVNAADELTRCGLIRAGARLVEHPDGSKWHPCPKCFPATPAAGTTGVA